MNTEQDLLKKVKRHPEDSVDKCKDILQLVKTLVNSNPAEAVKWCIKGLEISKKIGYAEGASFNDSIGIANVYAGSFFDALKYFNIALQYYDQKLKRKLEQEDEIFTQLNTSKVKNNIAIVYQNLGLLEEAMKIHEDNLKFYIEKDFKKDALLSLLNISSVAVENRDFNGALKAIDKFFIYYKKHKIEEPTSLGMAYVNRLEAKNAIASINNKTINDYFKAIEIFKLVKNFRFVRLVYINLSEYYESQPY